MCFILKFSKIIPTVSHTQNIKNYTAYDINIKVVKAQISMKQCKNLSNHVHYTLLEYKCKDEMDENHKISLWETIQQETMLRQKDPPV